MKRRTCRSLRRLRFPRGSRGYTPSKEFRLIQSKIQGVFPPITTPFQANTSQGLDLDALEKNVRRYLDPSLELSGLVVLGSNGEFPSLTKREQLQVLQKVSHVVRTTQTKRDDFLLIAGTGYVSTHETIDMTKEAKKMGYDAAMIVTPYYYTSGMQDKKLIHHYETIADNVDGIPLILYNVPPLAGGVQFGADAVARLARHENIAGMKDTAGNIGNMATNVGMARRLAAENPENEFKLLAGSGSYLLPAMIAGMDGGVMALANIYPKELSVIHRLYREAVAEGDMTKMMEAQRIQSCLVVLNSLVTGKYGSSGLKFVMDQKWNGDIIGGQARLPNLPLTSAAEQELLNELDRTETSLNEIRPKI